MAPEASAPGPSTTESPPSPCPMHLSARPNGKSEMPVEHRGPPCALQPSRFTPLPLLNSPSSISPIPLETASVHRATPDSFLWYKSVSYQQSCPRTPLSPSLLGRLVSARCPETHPHAPRLVSVTLSQVCETPPAVSALCPVSTIKEPPRTVPKVFKQPIAVAHPDLCPSKCLDIAHLQPSTCGPSHRVLASKPSSVAWNFQSIDCGLSLQCLFALIVVAVGKHSNAQSSVPNTSSLPLSMASRRGNVVVLEVSSKRRVRSRKERRQ